MSSPVPRQEQPPPSNTSLDNPNPTTQFANQDEETPQPEDPKSPKTLTLEIPDTEDLIDPDQDDPEEITPFSATAAPATKAAIATYRRRGVAGGPKRKKAGRWPGQGKKSQKKLEALAKTMNLVPFVPVKTLDFVSRKELLKRIGLWDFVHVEFNGNVRADLVAQLIANFNREQRCSYVNGVRIRVSRADLGRALKLPKKDKVSVVDNLQEVKESEENIGFVEDLVSNWMLLHEDAWMMPAEVLNWMMIIKEGSLEKVDWAAMMWFMVEKELVAMPELGNWYYASHLQCLIKHQKEELFKEEIFRMGVDIKEDKDEEDVRVCEEIQGGLEMEEREIELSLVGLVGPENVVKDADNGEKEGKELVGDNSVTDFEESKEEEEQGKALKSSMEGNFLGRCNQGGVMDLEFEEERECVKDVEEMKAEEVEGEEMKGEEGEGKDMKEEAVEAEEMKGEEEEMKEEEVEGEEDEELEEEEVDFNMSPNGRTFEGVVSENLTSAMEAAQIPITSGLKMPDNVSSGEFLMSSIDAHRMPGSSFLFGNVNENKRVIEHLDNDLAQQSLNGGNKRMRSDGAWDTKLRSDVDICMEEMQHVMEKFKMIYDAKDQACQEISMNQQFYISELQRRENIIQQLKEARDEGMQKRLVDVYRLERELCMMGRLLEWYRKALKETQKAFTEYRAKCQVPEEPIYNDTGSGGLVLSKMDLERQRLRREDEERLCCLQLEKKVKEFEGRCISKFEDYREAVEVLSDKLSRVEKEANLLKEKFATRLTSNMPEVVPKAE